MGRATKLELLWDRQTEWQRRLTMIRGAQRFLYVSIYYIEVDAYGREFLSALLEAARRGVRVSLCIDGFGQKLGGVIMDAAQRRELRDGLATLEELGARVIIYRPTHLVQQRLGGGQHVKIQVSETGELIFGSSNITHSSFEAWNELSVALSGPLVTTIFESLESIGCSVAVEDLRAVESAAANSARLDGLELDYWFCNPNLHQGALGPLGWASHNPLTDSILGMIDSAQTSLRISSFYFKPAPVLEDAILRAAARGVDVEIFHSHRHALPATDLAWIGGAVRFGRYLRSGVRIYENRSGEHSKIIVVDSTWAAFGSYNLEHAAHDRLAEAMLATRESSLVNSLLEIFDELRADPNTVSAREALDSVNPKLRLKMALLGPLRRWL